MFKKAIMCMVALSITTAMAAYKTKTEKHYENKDPGGTAKGLATRVFKGKKAHEAWKEKKREQNNNKALERGAIFDTIRGESSLQEPLKVLNNYRAKNPEQVYQAYDEIVHILNEVKGGVNGPRKKFLQKPLRAKNGQAGMFGEKQRETQKLQKMFLTLRQKDCVFSIRTDSHFPGMLVASCGTGALKKDQVLDGRSLFGQIKTPSKISQMRHKRQTSTSQPS